MAHSVWGTKNRLPFLKKEIRSIIFDHIKENARSKRIFIDRINGAEDHIHVLHGLNADISLSKTLQLIKGESSFWINKEKILPVKFEWADEYFSESVSKSALDSVRLYIDQQEEHHRIKTFEEEYQEFLKNQGFNFK